MIWIGPVAVTVPLRLTPEPALRDAPMAVVLSVLSMVTVPAVRVDEAPWPMRPPFASSLSWWVPALMWLLTRMLWPTELAAVCPVRVVSPHPVAAAFMSTPWALLAISGGRVEVPVMLSAPPLPVRVPLTVMPLGEVLVWMLPRPVWVPVRVRSLSSVMVMAF